MTRLLVCGGRDFEDGARLFRYLDSIHEKQAVTVVIEGEAPGADRLAADWAQARGIEVERYPADWTDYGKAAGPIRNRQMLLEGKPDLVVAFPSPESRGTWHMVGVAQEAGVPVEVVP